MVCASREEHNCRDNPLGIISARRLIVFAHTQSLPNLRATVQATIKETNPRGTTSTRTRLSTNPIRTFLVVIAPPQRPHIATPRLSQALVQPMVTYKPFLRPQQTLSRTNPSSVSRIILCLHQLGRLRRASSTWNNRISRQSSTAARL